MNSDHRIPDRLHGREGEVGYTSKSVELEEVRRSGRFSLIKGDDRFTVIAQVINSDSNRLDRFTGWLNRLLGKVVILKIGNDKLLLNINDIAKRCHLMPKEIEYLKRGEELPATDLNSFERRAKQVEASLIDYENIIALSKSREWSFLYKPERDEALRKACLALNSQNTVLLGSQTPSVPSIYIASDNEKNDYYLKKNEKGAIELIKIPIGNGGLDLISAVLFDEKGNRVMQEDESIILSDLMTNELNYQSFQHKLEEIHSEKQVLGIQEKPKGFVRIRTRMGYVTNQYDGSLANKLRPDMIGEGLKKNLFEFVQLLSGLSVLKGRGWVNQNFQAKDILIKEQDGYRLAHICVENFEEPSYSQTKYSQQDIGKMGLIFHQMLTGSLPEKGGMEYEPPEEIPKEIGEILKEMIHPQNRISAEEALSRLKESIHVIYKEDSEFLGKIEELRK